MVRLHDPISEAIDAYEDDHTEKGVKALLREFGLAVGGKPRSKSWLNSGKPGRTGRIAKREARLKLRKI